MYAGGWLVWGNDNGRLGRATASITYRDHASSKYSKAHEFVNLQTTSYIRCCNRTSLDMIYLFLALVTAGFNLAGTVTH
jgi:hypothetical protein